MKNCIFCSSELVSNPYFHLDDKWTRWCDSCNTLFVYSSIDESLIKYEMIIHHNKFIYSFANHIGEGNSYIYSSYPGTIIASFDKMFTPEQMKKRLKTILVFS